MVLWILNNLNDSDLAARDEPAGCCIVTIRLFHLPP